MPKGSKFSALSPPDDDEPEEKKTGQLSKSQKARLKKEKKQQQIKQMTTSSASSTITTTTSKDQQKKVVNNPPPSTVTTSASSGAKKSPKRDQIDGSSNKESSGKGTGGVCPFSLPHAPPPPSPTQELFLWSVSACYLFAFISFYYQIRGLYGENGILPLTQYASTLSGKNSSFSPEDFYAKTGSLIWYLAAWGFSLTSTLELFTLAGIAISLGQLFFKSLRNLPNYVFLFGVYYSLFKVGQVFLHFQWDVLLLEVGFITALASLRGGRFSPDSRLVM